MNSSDTLGQDRHSSFASASFPPKFSHEIAQVSFPVGPLRVSSEDADPGSLQFRPRLILITTNWRVWVGKLPVSAHTLPLNTHCVFLVFLLVRLYHQCKHISLGVYFPNHSFAHIKLLGLVLGSL